MIITCPECEGDGGILAEVEDVEFDLPDDLELDVCMLFLPCAMCDGHGVVEAGDA